MDRHFVSSCLLLAFLPLALSNDVRPNIVIIVADDLGFNDVSFHGSNEFLTPNIDALAYNGIILNRFYTPPMCTPSRASLLTGKHPIHLGMQHYVIPNDEPWGLPLKEKTIAQVFKEEGYSTSLIGKWHLGFVKKAYTPLFRGFDRHYGYLGAYVDYYDHTLFTKNYSRGHDFRNNLEVDHSIVGTYLTDSLTDEAIRQISSQASGKPFFMIVNHLAPHSGNNDKPLQAPKEEIEKFNYIPGAERRIYAAMVSKLDTSVGQIIRALADKGILENTIVIFYSDNGAPMVGLHSNHGDNSPLKGQKNSPWEGALRVPAIVWSKNIGTHGHIWDQYMHVMDWLPTLATAAGIRLNHSIHVDGTDFWKKLQRLEEPHERQLLHNIDDIFHYVAYSSGDWKYVNGTTNKGEYDGWLRHDVVNYSDPRAAVYEETIRESLAWSALAPFNNFHQVDLQHLRSKAQVRCSAETEVRPCRALQGECLFNLRTDPCEQDNVLGGTSTPALRKLLSRLRYEVLEIRQTVVPPRNKPTDPKCDPGLHGNEWTWWRDVNGKG